MNIKRLIYQQANYIIASKSRANMIFPYWSWVISAQNPFDNIIVFIGVLLYLCNRRHKENGGNIKWMA
jgi:hypothetical protein